MKSVIEKKEKNMVVIKVDVPAEMFEKGVQTAYNKEKGKFKIPGFRKGKVPKKIIEMNYGKGVFYEGSINEIFPEVYESAIKEHKLEPIDRPSLDIGEIESGKPVQFTMEVAVKPEVELGEYLKLEVEKEKYEIEDEAVDNELKKIQDTNARLVSIEDRSIKNGDIVNLNYSGFIEEEQFEGGTAENQTLEIGSGSFIPGFEEQLVGKNIGEEAEIKVIFPEEYHAEKLSGKEAVFQVKINEIKEKDAPELDDELAKDVSEFDTLEELKEDIKKKISEQKEKESKVALENKIVEKVCDNSKMDIPDVMVESQIDNNVNDFAYRLKYQGLDIEKYLELNKINMEEFRNQFRENAEKFVRGDLVLEAIGKKENVEVNDEDLESELDKLSKEYGQDINDFKKRLNDSDLDYIRSGIVKKKTLDFLVKNAAIV